MGIAERMTMGIAMVMFSGGALADDEFRVQAQLAYDQVDFGGGPFAPEDTDAITARGTFFFAPVSTQGVPVGEAAYINRASYAEVLFSTIDFGIGDANVLAANVGYHVPNTIFFGRVGVARLDADDSLGGFEDTNWNGTFGIVPIPRLFFGTDFTEDGYDPNITARYAGKLANDHWWAGSVAVIDPDEGDTDVGIQFDYYFPSFKVGGGYSTAGEQLSARLEFGLPHGFALQGTVFTEDDSDSDGLGLQLTWRDL
jgi:hypothetical protein